MSSQQPPPPLPWVSVPIHVLLEELARRQGAPDASEASEASMPKPKCGGSEKMGSYNTALHVFALFLILVVSTLSCGLPLLSRRIQKTHRPSTVLVLCQHFGTGVLMATAFVHLLPTAFISLTDPCLPDLFSKHYTPMAGLVAMTAALSVVALESYLTTRGAGHSHSHHHHQELLPGADTDTGRGQRGASRGFSAKRTNGRRPPDMALADLETQGLVAGASPLPGSIPPSPMMIHEDDGDASKLEDAESVQHEPTTITPATTGPGTTHINIEDPEDQSRLLVQCILLEAGILFHSVFIGMAISVAEGNTFIVFLVAISFHQCFEGLALGSRIAAIHFPRGSPRPWLMVLAFGCTTPLGQAIGLLMHNMYDPRSQAGLLSVGFMNAISSGLLLFAGMVQLLAEDFLSEKSYKILKGRERIYAYLAVLGGASLMAAVGAFA